MRYACPIAAAEADRDTAVAQARREVTAAEADRDAAIHQARAEADQRVSAADADRDQARQLAADSAGQARLPHRRRGHQGIQSQNPDSDLPTRARLPRSDP